jgi:glycosyltransferase involved in cell wall biosynthesis
MGKILVISDWAPPMIDGPSIILGNILREFDPDKLVLFVRRRNKERNVFFKSGNELNVKRYSIFIPSSYASKFSLLRRFYRLAEAFSFPLTVIKGLAIILKEKPDCILATSNPPHGHFMIAAYIMSKVSGKSLLYYIFDDLEEFSSGRLYKYLTKYFEPRMFKHASKIIVMDEYLAEHYEKKYGLRCKVLHHSVNLKNREKTSEVDAAGGNIYRILFSGYISRYNLDAILNLKNAIKSINHNIQFVMYTPRNEKTLMEMGILGKGIICSHIPYAAIGRELKKADLLFLPLSFENSKSIIVKSAFPSKTMDYLAAGRPVLIHAPCDCFIVDYARQNKFAEVITDNSSDSLARAIESLIKDSDKQHELIKHSFKTLCNHDSELKYNELVKILENN